ncbi:hypothetical protein TIFTF001_033414 [Ficus carica]|uniref:CCHC-type domain-containing protein n=1 Tax=Ficus carica TaxID=3494 RepID=A0AA88E0L7_FICCA|nr:hypothetical protein TIFTF001_033414 [Ficus carica]
MLDFCYGCGIVGHAVSMCPEEDNYVDAEELGYGDWLRSESTGRSQARVRETADKGTFLITTISSPATENAAPDIQGCSKTENQGLTSERAMERVDFSIKKVGNVVISKAKGAERGDSDLGVKAILGPGGVGPSAEVRDKNGNSPTTEILPSKKNWKRLAREKNVGTETNASSNLGKKIREIADGIVSVAEWGDVKIRKFLSSIFTQLDGGVDGG